MKNTFVGEFLRLTIILILLNETLSTLCQMARCIKELMMIITFNVISISLGPLQVVTYTISEDIFTVVLVKMRECYFCHFTTIIPNPVNV